MFNLQLKRVQSALSDGQLDEAFRLVRAEGISRCRKGQKLVTKVAKALAKRGKDHLAAERLQHALSDCNKADELGGNRSDIAELRRTICKRVEEKQYQHQQRNQQLAQAQAKMDDGWLSVGEEILGDVEHAEAEMLLQEAGAKRKLAGDVAGKAEMALKRGNLEEAIEILRRGRVSMNQDAKIAEQIGRIRGEVVKRVKDYLNSGRVDLAGGMLGRLSSLDGDTIEVKQLQDAVAICGEASRCVSQGEARQAVQLLGKLKMLLPGAKWVDGAKNQALKCAESLETLGAGPLGLSICERIDDVGSDVADEHDEVEESKVSIEKKEGGGKVEAGGIVPSRFVLQVDGVGAFYVLREGKVTVGPISSAGRPAVGLVADPSLPLVSIERHDEDYILRSDEPIGVGDQQVGEKLLCDGDKIALSNRCRMKFNVPNAASNTATLLLSSAKLTRPDINHVILMDRDILIGSGVSNHIRTSNCNESVALFVRDGKLHCRTQDSVIVGGKEYDSRGGLPLDTPMKIGRLSIVVVSKKDNLPG